MSVMPSVTIVLNGEAIPADPGLTIAAVLLSRGQQVFRRSVAGEARGPLCGMGICFECRVSIDGKKHVRSCNALVADGMEVVTLG